MVDGKKKSTEMKKGEDKPYEEIMRVYMSSSSFRKVWNYFLAITKTDYFTNTIKELRAKYKMPKNGFKLNGKNSYIPPKESVLHNNYKKLRLFRKEISEKICKNSDLNEFWFIDIIEFFIFYNILEPMHDIGVEMGLCRVSDHCLEKNDPFGKSFQNSDDAMYPISIRISPYASQRDIIDYIKNKSTWNEIIRPLQEKYKDRHSKLGRVKQRDKKIQARNDLIYKNKNKKLSEIRKILADKNEYLDDGHISKIIQIETLRRKEV